MHQPVNPCRLRFPGQYRQMSTDLFHVGEKPVEIEFLDLAPLPVASGFDEQKAGNGFAQSLHETSRLGQMMEGVEHQSQVNGTRRIKRFDIGQVELHVL